jgi:hypothetical protein
MGMFPELARASLSPVVEGSAMQPYRGRSSLLILRLTVVFLLAEATRLQAHDDLARRRLADGDASRAEWFETLKTPSGESCCNLSDCSQIPAEWRGDTEGWWVLVSGAWRPVPADKVLTYPRSIDGAAYLCMGSGSRGDAPAGLGSVSRSISSLLGVIYCFVPPDLGS